MYTKNIVYLKSGLVLNLELDHDDTVLLNKSYVDGKEGIISVIDHSKIDDTDIDGLKKHLNFHLGDSLRHISNVVDVFNFSEDEKKESHLYHIKLSEIVCIIEEGGEKAKKPAPKKQTPRSKAKKSTK
jgi:hypothetical protein